MSIFTKRSKRIVAGSLAGALALSVTPIMGLVGTASAADALPPIADPIGAGNFCENAPTTEPFTDVSATDPAIDEIICLVATELTTGVTATTYEPNSSITRRQMALFMKRVADLANELELTALTALPAYDGVPDFLDIAGESAAVKEAIGQLVQADIVEGTTATTYSPRGLVSRRQMAAFINRLQDFLTGDPFTTTGDFFNDDAGDTGEANLNAVASVGIFQGDGVGNVDPGGDLTRRQMAFVLLRYLQVLFDNGDVDGAFVPTSGADFPADAAGPLLLTNDADDDFATQSVTFTGLTDDQEVDIAVTYCGEVNTVDGAVRLNDDYEYDGEYGYMGDSEENNAEITEIDGDDTSTSYEDEYTVTGTSVTVEVSNENNLDTGDCLWLFVWADVGDDDELSVDNANKPTEEFGAVGPIVFTRGEAPNNTTLGDEVIYVDKTADFFLLSDGYQYFWDSADVPHYDNGTTISVPLFETAVSIWDDMTYFVDPYSRTGSNTFDLEDDYGYANGYPTGVTASVGDFDDVAADTALNDIEVAWTPPTTDIDPSFYCIDLYNTLGTATRGDDTYFDSDCTDTDTPADHDFVFEDTDNGTFLAYVYAYSQDSSASYSGPLSDPSAVITVTVSSVPGPPQTLAAPSGAVHTDGDGNGYVSAGDTLVFTFEETMDDPAATAQLLLHDGADGTMGQLINGTNATFAKIAANRIAVIVTAPGPVILAPGTTANLQYVGLTASDAGNATTGIVDADEGLDWDFSAGDLNP